MKGGEGHCTVTSIKGCRRGEPVTTGKGTWEDKEQRKVWNYLRNGQIFSAPSSEIPAWHCIVKPRSLGTWVTLLLILF